MPPFGGLYGLRVYLDRSLADEGLGNRLEREEGMMDRIPSPYPEEEEPVEPRRAREDEDEESESKPSEHEIEEEPAAIP